MTGKRNPATAPAPGAANRTLRILAILALLPVAVLALLTLVANILWHDLRKPSVDWGVCIG